jgi:hypothetical protein
LGQNAANVVNAFGRSSATTTNTSAVILQHMAEAVLQQNPSEISAQVNLFLISTDMLPAVGLGMDLI